MQRLLTMLVVLSVLGALVRLGAVHVGELDEDEGGPT
jgi:hypothetical protein